MKELCQLLELPESEPTQADESKNTYFLEKAVSLNNGDETSSTGRVDPYRQRLNFLTFRFVELTGLSC